MDIKQLRALIAIDEHGSFSSAARSLHTVQSNVSTHIARLERELDMNLVDRSSNGLTAEGHLVVQRARRIEAEFEALRSDVASARDEVIGTVRIGVIGTTARWLVPPLLNELRDEHPKIRAVLLDAPTSSLVLQLAGGQIDMAVVNTPLDDPAVTVTDLFVEDPTLVVPHGHELAGPDTADFEDVARHELLLPAPGTLFREELDEAAADAGVTLRPQAEIEGMRLLASLAFSGFGAAILPASAAPGWLGGDWSRVRVEGLPTRTVGLAHRRRALPSAADRMVAETITSVVRRETPHQIGIHLFE